MTSLNWYFITYSYYSHSYCKRYKFTTTQIAFTSIETVQTAKPYAKDPHHQEQNILPIDKLGKYFKKSP